ncbi:DUF11 domain-containing protein [Spirillospora sp. NPDC052269]
MGVPRPGGGFRHLRRTRALAVGALACAMASATITTTVTGQARAETATNITGSGRAHWPTPPVPLADWTPDISLYKTADRTTFAGPGELITYNYRVTNTGNTPLINVYVVDVLPGLSPVTCPVTYLDVGEFTDCTATYETTAEDVARGSVHNAAIAHGVTPNGLPPVESPPSEVIVPVETPPPPPPVRHPGISLHKRVHPKTFSRVGQLLRYSYRVTNTGDVTLHNVVVVDRLRGLSAIRCPKGTLGRGESMTCTATRRITRHDLKPKCIRNVAVAQGTPPESKSPVTSRPARATACGIVPVTG